MIAAERLGIAFPRGAWERDVSAYAIAHFGAFVRVLALDRRLVLAGHDRVGQHLHDQLDRAHAVVVARDRQIDQVRIAVGVDQRDRGDAQLLGFADRVLFLLRIDDDQALGQPVHRADAVQVAEHLAIFAVERRLHLLRVGVELASSLRSASSSSRRVSRLRIVRKLVSVPPSQRSLTNGMPQRRASRPMASAACRFVPTNSTRLPCEAICVQVLLGPQQAADRFADVDDVNQILAGVNIRPHLRVPAAGAVAEVDAGFDQFFNECRHKKLLEWHTG